MSQFTLPNTPKDKDFEDYVSAFIQLSGRFLERGVIYRIAGSKSIDELLELDIVTTQLTANACVKEIVEIKSGDWGYSDIFKVYGWLKYMDIQNGVFVVQKPDRYTDVSQNVTDNMNIKLLLDDKFEAKAITSHYGIDTNKPWFKAAIATLRYAYAIEKGIIENLSRIKNNKLPGDSIAAKHLLGYINGLCNNSFFEPDSVSRARKLSNLFIDNHCITARIANRSEGDTIPPYTEGMTIPYADFVHVFSGAPHQDILHAAIYTEYLNRLLVLRSTVEYALLWDPTDDNDFKEFMNRLGEACLINNIREAALQLKDEPYAHLYPYFWQIFIYLFGGFILTDKEDGERQILSEITGIPIYHIDNAFNAFDVLFPIKGGKRWIVNQSNSNIKLLNNFSLPLLGAGVIFRMFYYAPNSTPDNAFDDMTHQLRGRHTADDLARWFNTALLYIERFKKK